MTEKHTVFLSNAAASLPSFGNLSHLKSHLLWVCSTIGGKGITNASVMCPKCCQVWNAGKFSFHLKAKSQTGPRMMKILRKVKKPSAKLSRVEMSLLRRHQQVHGNQMVLTCVSCKHQTTAQFLRPALEADTTPHKVEEEDAVLSTTKKKKKKDRFAGLNASAVLSATPSPLAIVKHSVRHNRQASIATPGTPTAGQESRTPKSCSNAKSLSPKSLRTQLIDSNHKKSAPRSIKKKMNLLREEVKLAEQNRVKEEIKAFSIRNLNIKKNSKLQDFLSKREKDVHLEDRINSLLQF